MIIQGCNCRWSIDLLLWRTCDICRYQKDLVISNIVNHQDEVMRERQRKVIGKMALIYDGVEYTGDVTVPESEFNKPKKPKPLTIKRAVKFLRKHPEVESIKLTEFDRSDNLDYKDAEITFDSETVYEEEIISGRSTVLSFKVRSSCTIKLIKDIK